jgi:serine/threonine protein kinase
MKFGQYELRELIAVGGMAEVYKGRVVGAEGFEKFVAIKRILPDLAEDERFVKMLLTEARIHSALSHRNIVQIHDLGISEHGEYFIVLEYVEGYDLRMITDQLSAAGEIIPEVLSLHIASELAQGLHFAHELCGADGQPLGLVHRDVSPSNVLISLAGEIKLSDFGLAKRRHDRSVVGSLKGNLAYMSPEQARQSTLDRRTDVFSLGAVLFELLTGRRLREITDEIAGWNHVASGEIPSVRAVRPDLPEAFERLLTRALAPEPENRFPDAAAFGTAIRATLAQLNTPVGANDLQMLLSTLSPVRRPREIMPERSKVIRLGPEAQALGEAIAAPNTPRPVAAPGMTPLTPRAPGGVSNLPDEPRRSEPRLTPPPLAPLQPVQPWRARERGPVPLPRGDRRTPPAPMTSTDVAPARLHSAVSAAALPSGGGWQSAGAAAAAAALQVAAPAPASAYEPRPSTAEHLPVHRSQPRLPTQPTLAPPPRPHRETIRVVKRDAGNWRTVVVTAMAVLLIAAAGIHFAYLPLDVLFVWRKPATLLVTTDPPGATGKLDGVALEGPTPTRVSVRRDRAEHVLQLSAPGYKPARQVVRYDGAVTLATAVRLDKEIAPTFEPLPAAAPPPPVAAPSRPAGAAPAAVRKAKASAKATKTGKAARPKPAPRRAAAKAK